VFEVRAAAGYDHGFDAEAFYLGWHQRILLGVIYAVSSLLNTIEGKRGTQVLCRNPIPVLHNGCLLLASWVTVRGSAFARL
jgi:hypothetical protein